MAPTTSSRVRKQAPVLKYLCKANPRQARAIINTADNELLNTLCECSLNVLKGGIPVSTHQKKKLRRFKKQLRTLSSKRIPLTRKKKLLQKGGFLSALLAPIAGVLTNLLGV